MAKPSKTVTPDNRLDHWKKLWATPRLLDSATTDAAFEHFQQAFVPSHMVKKFLQFFFTPKAHFGNRFFMEDAVYQSWDKSLASLGAGETSHVEVTVVYASSDRLEGHGLRGQPRRTLRDIVVDDWQAACAIIRSGGTTLYVFIEPKMRGCIVRTVRSAEDASQSHE